MKTERAEVSVCTLADSSAQLAMGVVQCPDYLNFADVQCPGNTGLGGDERIGGNADRSIGASDERGMVLAIPAASCADNPGVSTVATCVDGTSSAAYADS
ncbi:hypothetical protein PC128_g18439 [Phytophthora cactorum]|nr:hypothetical protein PC128_g18439 [Phytophthora cactorum]KAG4039846.1 hypothetical protein PC123_g24606 [Phytophthora cactorum]